MVGHEMPSASVARQFLYAFHEEAKIEEAKRERRAEQIAYIPEETEPLVGFRGGQSGTGAGVGTALPGAAHRHRGSGCHDHREPEARSLANLRGRTGLSADVGGMGGEERGAGG